MRPCANGSSEDIRAISSATAPGFIRRNALCAEVINSLDSYLSKIENRAYLREYRSRELLTGNIITAKVGNETVTGRALGIDRNANLMIETENGIVRSLSSGEANLCRIKE